MRSVHLSKLLKCEMEYFTDLAEDEMESCHNQEIALQRLLNDCYRRVLHGTGICTRLQLVHNNLLRQLYG